MYPNQPGMPPQPNPGMPPSNNLAFAIVTTILCCLPFGIAAIVFAAQVNSKWGMGDYAGAQESAAKAKKFSIISAVVGGIGIAIYAIFMITTANSLVSTY